MQKPHRRLRIAVAGAGAFGREHLGRLMARNDVEVVGVSDPSSAALDVVRDRFAAVPLYSDSPRLIGDTQADGVVVATPASSHFELTQLALSRGISVLLEKPAAATAGEAARLEALSSASSAFVLPGHVLRFSKDHARLAGIVESGTIGDVLYVNSRRYRDASHATRYPDTDPVLMTMIHDIDLAVWLVRSLFRSVHGSRSGRPGFRSLTTAHVTTESGVCCDLRTAWVFEAGDIPADRLEVVGDRGSIELDVEIGLQLYADGRLTRIPLEAADDPLVNEHDHFVSNIRSGSKDLRVTLADATRGLKLAEAIIESFASGREVNVPR